MRVSESKYDDSEFVNSTQRVNHIKNGPVLNLIIDTFNKGKQAIVFVNSKRSAEKVAEDASKELVKLIKDKKTLEKLNKCSEEILSVLSTPTNQCERLAKCIRGGTAFHHAGLVSKQKQIVEDGFRDGFIKIIVATPTLAAGVDLPAYRVIIRDLKRHTNHGFSYIPVLEYHQQAGRAGRPSYDTKGEAICLAKTEKDKYEILINYLFGLPENIYSKLAVEPVLKTYILSLISTEITNSFDDITDFFGRTFWGYQYQDIESLSLTIRKMIKELISWGFIESNTTGSTTSLESASLNTQNPSNSSTRPPKSNISNKSESDEFFQSAYDIAENSIKKENNSLNSNNLSNAKPQEHKLKATKLGNRVSQLYLDPDSANTLIEGLKRINERKERNIDPFLLLHLACSTIEMRPLLNLRNKDYDEIEEIANKHEDYFLTEVVDFYDPMYEDFLKAIKTAGMFNDWINEKNEEYILEKYSIKPGVLSSKINLLNWLLYSMLELAKIVSISSVSSIEKLRERVKYGAKEELLPLLRLKNIGKIRARSLYSRGFKSLALLKKADINELSKIVGNKLALNIKEQLGIDTTNYYNDAIKLSKNIEHKSNVTDSIENKNNNNLNEKTHNHKQSKLSEF